MNEITRVKEENVAERSAGEDVVNCVLYVDYGKLCGQSKPFTWSGQHICTNSAAKADFSDMPYSVVMTDVTDDGSSWDCSNFIGCKNEE